MSRTVVLMCGFRLFRSRLRFHFRRRGRRGEGFLVFLDEVEEHSRDGVAVEAAGRFRPCAVGVDHVLEIERFLGADVTVVVERQLAALTALQVLRHYRSFRVRKPHASKPYAPKVAVISWCPSPSV